MTPNFNGLMEATGGWPFIVWPRGRPLDWLDVIVAADDPRRDCGHSVYDVACRCGGDDE